MALTTARTRRYHAVDFVDPEVIEIIQSRADAINEVTTEIMLFQEQALGLDLNTPDGARALATWIVEAICH